MLCGLITDFQSIVFLNFALFEFLLFTNQYLALVIHPISPIILKNWHLDGFPLVGEISLLCLNFGKYNYFWLMLCLIFDFVVEFWITMFISKNWSSFWRVLGDFQFRIKGERIQCEGCGHKIQDRYLMKIGEANWHEQCVVCSVCHILLNHSCYLRDSKLYCKMDYDR